MSNLCYATGGDRSTNPGDNAGFLQLYIGGTIAYVPFFTNIAP